MVDAAKFWIEREYNPLPIPDGKTHPGKGWNKLRIDATNVAQYFNGKFQNMSVFQGDAVGHVDVDLDSREALACAHAFLPSTGMVFGRKSNPASHWFYSCGLSCPRTEKFQDPLISEKEIEGAHKRMLVELRGLKTDGSKYGHPTRVPPSIHVESGETYEFLPGLADYPATVKGDALRQAVTKLAACALLARYWPEKGQGRHSAMLALAGALARANWTEEEAQHFCSALYTSIPTHDRKAVKRVTSEVRDSFTRIQADKATTGIPTLAEYLHKDVVRAALEWLQAGEVLTGTVAVAPELRTKLLRNEDGGIRPLLENAALMLEQSEPWNRTLSFDEFSLCLTYQERVLADEDTIQITRWLQRHGCHVSTKVAAEAVQVVARQRSFHPVRDYLNALAWDEKARLDTWLADYMGAENNDWARTIGPKWMISAVARIFQPGEKVDHTLLLKGPQGAQKSRALRSLVPKDLWFTDHISDLGNKDSRIELRGKWIIELAELDRVRKSEQQRVDAFLTAQKDSYRPPYGRYTIDVPRQCVFAATVNDETPLTNEYGGRRWWPVNCGHIDFVALEANRDQLWAEAIARYKKDEKWWLETEEQNKLAAAAQDDCYEPGVWDDPILSWIRHPKLRPDRQVKGCDDSLVSNTKRVLIDEILEHAIHIDSERWTQAARLQVQRCLVHAKWKRKQIKIHKKPRWFYVHP